MSYEIGMAALNLEMTERVARTEGAFSAERHWDLVRAVTGIEVTPQSSPEEQQKASNAFVKAWDYDFVWSTLIYNQVLGDIRTSMGHAVYDAGGTDFRDDRQARLCPFQTPEQVLDFQPWDAYGKIDPAQVIEDFHDHYHANCRNYPDAVNCTGIYITCISGLIEIFGWDMLLLAAGEDMKKFGEMTNRYASWIQQYFNALADTDVPVVMVHDDIVWTSGAFLAPSWYREYVFPNYKKYFAPLHDAGKIVLFTSDGNYTEFIDDIAGCGVNGFVLEPTTDMKYIAERYGKTHSFQGNADTRILLENDKEKIRAEVARCMEIGKTCPGFFLQVGNHIPSNTPVDAAVYYNQCYEQMSRRTLETPSNG